MAIVWYEVEPVDRETALTMRFYMTSCQRAKTWALDRMTKHHRKRGGVAGTAAETQHRWLTEYLRSDPVAKGVPRATLAWAFEQIWRRGPLDKPQTRKDWRSFSVEARPGWRRYISIRHKVNWSAWLNGKQATQSIPRVTAAQAAQELFGEQRLLIFQWGRLRLSLPSQRQLARRLHQEEKEWFASLTRLTFIERGEGRWQVSFEVSAVNKSAEGSEEESNKETMGDEIE